MVGRYRRDMSASSEPSACHAATLRWMNNSVWQISRSGNVTLRHLGVGFKHTIQGLKFQSSAIANRDRLTLLSLLPNAGFFHTTLTLHTTTTNTRLLYILIDNWRVQDETPSGDTLCGRTTRYRERMARSAQRVSQVQICPSRTSVS